MKHTMEVFNSRLDEVEFFTFSVTIKVIRWPVPGQELLPNICFILERLFCMAEKFTKHLFFSSQLKYLPPYWTTEWMMIDSWFIQPLLLSPLSSGQHISLNCLTAFMVSCLWNAPLYWEFNLFFSFLSVL